MDSADRARIDEARTELHRIINDREMRDCLLLVLANKQDLEGGAYLPPSLSLTPLTGFPSTAMKPLEITEKLQLNKIKDKVWFVQPTVATKGDGLNEGFNWLSDHTKANVAAAPKK